ncbi:unnamed protein product, partial [marine sediment metagenome]
PTTETVRFIEDWRNDGKSILRGDWSPQEEHCPSAIDEWFRSVYR